jgi:hypothetical protein
MPVGTVYNYLLKKSRARGRYITNPVEKGRGRRRTKMLKRHKPQTPMPTCILIRCICMEVCLLRCTRNEFSHLNTIPAIMAMLTLHMATVSYYDYSKSQPRAVGLKATASILLLHKVILMINGQCCSIGIKVLLVKDLCNVWMGLLGNLVSCYVSTCIHVNHLFSLSTVVIQL